MSEASPETDALLDVLAAGGKAWVPALRHLELGKVLPYALKRVARTNVVLGKGMDACLRGEGVAPGKIDIIS